MAKALTHAQRGLRAVTSLPASVRVGPFDIEIIKWSNRESEIEHKYGEFSALEQAIRIRAEMSSAAKAVDTFLHELLHAVWWINDLTDAATTEEHIVGHVSSTLVQIYRDNPWLAGWIAENTR